LQAHSHAPNRHPNQTPAPLEQRILQLRRKYPRWGPRKLRGHLRPRYPETSWPAASTIGELLHRDERPDT
jgi:hypothetical protein